MTERFTNYILTELRKAHSALKLMQNNVETIGKDLSAGKIDAYEAVEQMVEAGVMRISVMQEGKNSIGGKKDNEPK